MFSKHAKIYTTMTQSNFGITAKNYSKAYRDLIGFEGDPKQFHVHHIDSNRSNNHHTNLVLIPSKLHGKYHASLNDFKELTLCDFELAVKEGKEIITKAAKGFLCGEIGQEELLKSVITGINHPGFASSNNDFYWHTKGRLDSLSNEILSIKWEQTQLYSHEQNGTNPFNNAPKIQIQ